LKHFYLFYPVEEKNQSSFFPFERTDDFSLNLCIIQAGEFLLFFSLLFFGVCGMIDKLAKRLEQNRFTVDLFQTAAEACDYLLRQIPAGASVGVGGSVTLTQIGLMEKLAKMSGITFLNQYADGISREDSLRIRREGLLSKIYFTGSNAVTVREGAVVNVDGVGNRVAALSFGPEKVYIVLGKNKIVPDIPAAIERIRLQAAPLNAKRLNRNTPCVETGVCQDCSSPDRICNMLSILKKQPAPGRISILLIDQDLGL